MTDRYTQIVNTPIGRILTRQRRPAATGAARARPSAVIDGRVLLGGGSDRRAPPARPLERARWSEAVRYGRGRARRRRAPGEGARLRRDGDRDSTDLHEL